MRHIRYLYFFATLFLYCTAVSCTQSTNNYEEGDDQLSGSGVLVSEPRELGNFNEVHSSGPITTVISYGATREILVTADDNVIQKVLTIVHGNALYISLKEGSYHNIWIRVKIILPYFTTLVNNGSGSMMVSNIEAEGALKVINSADGQVILEGRANSASLINESAGNISAYGLESSRCTVYNGGSGNCEINCNTLVEGSNSGSGTISYKGDPTIAIENNGTGGIINKTESSLPRRSIQ